MIYFGLFLFEKFFCYNIFILFAKLNALFEYFDLLLLNDFCVQSKEILFTIVLLFISKASRWQLDIAYFNLQPIYILGSCYLYGWTGSSNEPKCGTSKPPQNEERQLYD